MFLDRADAGSQLATKLLLARQPVNLAIGLARGGVVVSKVIATSLGIPHDVLVVKKIGSPGNSELAIGALAPDGVKYIDETLACAVGADESYIRRVISDQTSVIRQKTQLYKKGKKPLIIRGQTIILTDDGAATGATMYVAVAWAKKQGATKIIVALPVAPPDVVTRLRMLTDDVIILETPSDFGAVGEFYKNFPQLADRDVVELLS